jgi:hypothetical protein
MSPAPGISSEAPTGQQPWWRRMDMLATTSTVLVVGGTVLWGNTVDHGWRDSLAIASALLIYPAGLALLAGRTRGAVRVTTFIVAGVAAGSVAQMINGNFMIDRELGVAATTGAFVGVAHWVAARAWTRLLGSQTV